jgi:hypothetical protein
MISFSVPENKDVQAALGVLVIRHGHLEYSLRMTVKSLCDLSIKDALEDTKRKGPSFLRQRIEGEAKKKLGQCEAFEKLKNWLHRSWSASDKRNLFVHGLWAKKLDGPLLLQDENYEWGKPPTVQMLEILSDEIKHITDELNLDRLKGTLYEALKDNKKP